MLTCATRRKRATTFLVAAALALPAVPAPAAQPAVGGKACVGTLSGNLISPLPRPTVIRVHITDASSANVSLGERFKTGLASAGTQLSDSGGVTMELATTVTGAPTDSGQVSPEFGVVGRMPATPEPPVLVMSISLMDTSVAQIDWVGYVNCKIRTPDLGAVAQELGYAIGRSIGDTFSPRPL